MKMTINRRNDQSTLCLRSFVDPFCSNVLMQPLASAHGLAKHRDGRWEWAIAPGVSPSPRYQHAAVSSFIDH